ncbi:MAG: hypothetical protein PVG83_09265 [Acidimicrobiia bacterium]
MRRMFGLLSALAMILAACSPAATDSTTSTSAGTATSSASSASSDTTADAEGGATTTEATPTTTEPASDRPLAPDFTLALGDGGTYTLSEGTKPVYLVFWAEW